MLNKNMRKFPRKIKKRFIKEHTREMYKIFTKGENPFKISEIIVDYDTEVSDEDLEYFIKEIEDLQK